MRITKLSLLFFVMLFAAITKGQDTIHMRSGDVVVAKVSEIGTSEIKYKKWGRPDGPLYTVFKTDVASINYADGTKDVFPLTPAAANSSQPVTTYGGIGATIQQDSNYVQITGTDAGSPAANAGLGAGDKIVGVNGASTYGKTIFEVSSMITGQAGTPVMVEIIHHGSATPVGVTLIRQPISNTTAYTAQQSALQNLAAYSQYLNSLTPAQPPGIKYTMSDSTIRNMAKVRIGLDFFSGNLLEMTGRINATYSDYRNFMLSGFYGVNNERGAEGTFYFIHSSKTRPITIPFKDWDVWQGYTATHMVRYTVCTIQHNVEKTHDFGLHLGYAQKNLSDATEGWLLYDRWGGEANDISLYNKNLTVSPLPVYNEIAVGLQYAVNFAYDATLIYYNGTRNITSTRRTSIIVGFDVLIFPTLPKLDATYDSLTSSSAIATKLAQSQYWYDTWSNVPANNFSSYGYRIYCKWQWCFHNSGATDWGWELELAMEQNLAGFGYWTETGLYFGL